MCITKKKLRKRKAKERKSTVYHKIGTGKLKTTVKQKDHRVNEEKICHSSPSSSPNTLLEPQLSPEVDK
jgi:hypothetical protein